jgi:general secretion pathway protein A
MYENFYGLREPPFELTPNPRFLFLTRQHREALSTLEYGLFTAKGVTALIGEAGTGKTTLIYAALESERCRNVSCVYLNNPALTRSEFVETLSVRFGLSARAGASKAVLIDELEKVLRERRAHGQVTALVIDEAQSLSDELLEEIRLLANSETATEKLLPLVLAGQPELKDRLNEGGLRQLKQRVTLRCEITPFGQRDTAAYIAQRIRAAGGDAARLFSREAVVLIHERSGGIPRTISVICDNALLTGFALGRQPVDSGVILEVARDFDLGVARMPHVNTALPAQIGPGAERAVNFAPEGMPRETSQTEMTESETALTESETTPAPPPPDTALNAPAPPAEPPAEDVRELFAASSKTRHRFSLFGGR